MASPAMYGPPPRRHSVAGPLILIVIGLLFLLRNFGYSFPLHSIAKFWPLLLVVIGLVRLAEFFASRKAQRPMPTMGGGTVFLLVILSAAGMALSGVYKLRDQINWGSLRDNVDVDDSLKHLFEKEYTYSGELSQPISAGSALRIDCDHGNITVNSWDQPQVKVVYRKRIFARSQSEANSVNQSTLPKLQTQGSTVELQANTEGSGSKGVASDLEVFLPRQADIQLTALRGDVSIVGRTGEVKVSSQHGDVTLDRITGNVNVTTQGGSLHASNLTGNLAADGRLADLELETISGTVLVTADIFGDTQLSKLQRGAILRTSRTELQFAKLDGDLTMDSGGLQGDGLFGPLSLSTRAKDVTLRHLTGDVHISDDHGDIDLESTSLASLGNLDLTTHNGNVQLRLPPKANFKYEMLTRHGDISSDFENLRAAHHTGAADAAGAVGRGGVKINITSDNGDIEISKADTSTSPAKPDALPEPRTRPARPGKKVGDVEVM